MLLEKSNEVDNMRLIRLALVIIKFSVFSVPYISKLIFIL